MKFALALSLLFFGYSANAAANATANATDTFAELYQISCAVYENPAQDPAYSIDFSKDATDDTSVVVEIRERVASRIFKDTYWVSVYQNSEQATQNARQFAIGIDDVSIVIDKATMQQSRGKPNGEVEFRIGRTTKKLGIYCDKM